MKTRILFLLTAFAVMLCMGCKVRGVEEENTNDKPPEGETPVSYSINFNVNNGKWQDETVEGTELSVNQHPGTAVEFPENPVKEAALFMGWFTKQYDQLDYLDSKPADAIAISVDTVFKVEDVDPSVVLLPCGEDDGDVWAQPLIAYALWKKLDPDKIAVIFYNSKEDTEVLSQIYVDEGQSIAAVDIPVPSRGEHYNRVGGDWYRLEDDTVFNMNTVLTKSGTNPLKLFAQWQGKMYTAAFDLNYTEDDMPAPPQNLSLQYPETPKDDQIPKPTRNYYNFGGWWLSQTGSGTRLTTSTLFDGNKTFYAKWMESNEAKKDRTDLDDLTNEVGRELAEGNTEYEDDYIIGSGALAGASGAVETLLNSLNTKLSLANTLLQGTSKTITAKVEDGTGKTKDETITIIEYDYDAIKQVCDEIKAIKTNPTYSQILNGGTVSQKVITIDKPGQVHSVTIASGGKYQIEAWGASGGHIWSKNNATALGGKGGYVKGVVSLEKGRVLKVRVGGEGAGSSDITVENGEIIFKANVNNKKNPGLDGGWNGGGTGGSSRGTDYTGGSGGGGATDVRLIADAYQNGVNNKRNGVNTENNGIGVETGAYVDLLSTRIFTAGGGGGTGQSADVGSNKWPGIPGGDAGPVGAPGKKKGGVSDNAARGGKDAPQASISLDDSAKTSGSVLGAGGDGATSQGSNKACEGTGGGGGGYYGGESIQNKDDNTGHNTAFTASGAGGSNYVVNGAQNTANGVNPVYGPGKVIITYVGP